MSSYRNSYIPWQASLSSSNTNKQNVTRDRYGSSTNSRYSTRSSSYGISSAAATTAKTTTTTTTTATISSPSTNPYQTYRRSTPSVLKKYANFSSSNATATAIAVAAATAAAATAAASKKSEAGGRRGNAPADTSDGCTDKSVSGIPRCRPFGTKIASSYDASAETTSRHGGWGRFAEKQTARSPSREKAQPVFGVSNASVSSRVDEPVRRLFVSRATSPTPARGGRKSGDDDVLLSEMCISPIRRDRVTASCQTDERCDSTAPAPPCRSVASLTNKLMSASTSPVSVRYCPKANGGYAYTRPTDLPIRSPSARSSLHSPNDRVSPSADAGRGRLSPNLLTAAAPASPMRTPSPLAALQKSLNNLSLEAAAVSEKRCSENENDEDDTDSDTENDSSYDENYPTKNENQRYPYVGGGGGSIEFSDKPPKYPLSSNSLSRSKTIMRDNLSVESNCGNAYSVRCLSANSNSSGGGGGKVGSDYEDVCDKSAASNSHFNDGNSNSNSIREDGGSVSTSKPYAIRRIDSGEAPWWLNNAADTATMSTSPSPSPRSKSNESPQYGYRIRKLDSAESAWWCKASSGDSAGVSESNPTPESGTHSDSGAAASRSDNCRSSSSSSSSPAPFGFGYAVRKIDSADTPRWCSNEQDSSSRRSALDKPANDETTETFYKVRKFDSDENEWWAESENGEAEKSSTPSIPDWWSKAKSDDECDGCVETYKSNKVLRITKIQSVDKSDDGGVRENARLTDNASSDTDAEDEPNAIARRDNGDSYSGSCNLNYINELDNLLYIGDCTNIDDLLGTEVPPPAAPVTPTGDDSSSEDELGEGCEKITARQVKIHDGSAHTSTIHRRHYQLDDAALQLYKDGDYGSYLDLDSSISEQQEEFEGFQPSRKDSIVMRTQLSVRVHLIIEKLMKSEGRELRRALFSLKPIFQEDKDLVHEFVQNDGLDCLIKVGSDVDQNYQNYILRALGQVMLYVDGMNGVMEHNPTIQWLYSLVSSKFRLVVKTALKLLLLFVEYVESNCLLLVHAIHSLNISQGLLPWSNIMRLLHEYDATDTELLIYAMTLVNKTLNGLTDQDTYYDQVDLLEEQDIESVIRKYMSKQGTDLDLLRQFQIYEAVLQHEDGEDKSHPLKQLDETIRKTLRNRKSLTNGSVNSDERRKSRRHSTGTTALSYATSPHPHSPPPPPPPPSIFNRQQSEASSADDYRIKSTADGAGVTPGLRRRRERAERQRSLLREQYESNMRTMMDSTSSGEDGLQNGNANYAIPQVYVNNTVSKLECMEDTNAIMRNYQNGEMCEMLRREATVKDITQKLATLQTPDDNNKSQNLGRVEEMKGIISKAMEGLAKSQSRCDLLRSPTSECVPPIRAGVETKKSETDLHWEELLATSTRPLHLCDLDFSDLKSDDEHDVLAPSCNANGIPPPPPPCFVPPPVPAIPKSVANKAKKTVKLFWKEVREDPIVMTKLNSKQLIWDEMFTVSVDTQRLEHLFESRAKDLISKKQHELNKSKEIIVLDPKRSNAINIGMTKLPPPRSIKTAILKMDSTVMNREGIEKLLTMLPTEEERSKIQEAQAANPDLPLGTAEHFLLTLASISELTARLKLWAFKLNYENIEKEIADPLMDLKQGMEVLRTNKTFRAILSTLLSIGIFLNGTEVKGFQVEYLSKVPEVKDTVHKHSLLHHLCHIVMEKFADSTDLYSEIGAVTRASRVDFEELANSIERVKHECKASFDHLKAIAKHDGNTAVKLKLSDFLADCAERIIALGKIHRRLLNRFYKFCLWLGVPLHRIQATKPNELCKVISEFALEYRTTRERVIQQLEKKASHRERNKTRGKMITEVGKFKSKEDRQDAELRQLLGKEHSPEYDSNTNNLQCGSLPWRRQRKDNGKYIRDQNLNGHLTDADDELLETLVKTATKAPTSRSAPRERKRTRHSDRKSLRRTLKNGLTEEERNHLASYIKSY